MKILFLNPHIDAEHKIVKAIQDQGHAVLVPGNANEAWQLLQLHGTSVDMAVVHREGEGTGNDEAGLKLISKIKGDSTQIDLPYIVTSDIWGDTEFARHQQTSAGANAYLAWPFGATELLQIISAVLGQGTGHTAAPSARPPSAPGSSTAVKQKESNSALEISRELEVPVLEDAASALGEKEKDPDSTSPGIVLDAPDFDESFTASHSIPTAPREVSPASIIQNSDISISEPPAEATPSSIEEVPRGAEVSQPSGIEIHFDAPSQEENEPTIHWGDLNEGGAETEFQKEEEEENSDPGIDKQAAQDMPYLYQKGPGQHVQDSASKPDLAFVLGQPLGDAVVPGGAAHSPDAETLKKYLLLREQDVAVLSAQARTLQEQTAALEAELRAEKSKNTELTHTLAEHKRKVDDFEIEKAALAESLQSEINELRFQMRAKADRARNLETQVREAADETERLKERVRSDIRKIRVREKELENRLEIMKKDSETLISSRENKIIELKRKIDLLEFNMDLLQDQYTREKETSSKLRERLARAAQVVRVAGGLLEPSVAAEFLAAEDESKQEAS